MSFAVYVSDSQLTWRRQREVVLSGRDGIFARLVRARTAPGTASIRWRISETEALARLGFEAPENALVMDLKPADKKRVCLGWVRDIWGFSTDDSTTILIGIDVCKNIDSGNILTEKEGFATPEGRSGESLFAFMQLDGGVTAQTWRWHGGRPMPRIIPHDAMRFFMRCLNGNAVDDEPVVAHESSLFESQSDPLPPPPAEEPERAEMLNDLESLFGNTPRQRLPEISIPPGEWPSVPYEPPTPPPGGPFSSAIQAIQTTLQSLASRLSMLFRSQ